MKKLLTILLSVISLTIMAQVPQGVGYQGVATDANGIELVNQSISIRASVLSGSATGTIEWEETHATTTDTFGLFTLTIGQGTNTTNGLQTSFADISWGTNTHFLKIEMDVTGGTNYSFMGTNQIMSVPYALYAESANINYDSISNLLSNDSTFITNVGGGIGGGGCDWQFPEGIDGDPVFIDFLATSGYTVPSGKNLYITTSYYSNGSSTYITINGNVIVQAGNFGTPIIAKSGDVVHYMSLTNIPTLANCTGILVDINPQVEPIFVDLLANNYTVPNGKQLFLTKGNHTGSTGYITVDGQEVAESWNRPLPHIIKSGVIVGFTGTPTTVSFTGYLVDENYFAACGGGGSSSTSSLDSTTIANMIAGAGGGCNMKFPEGLDFEPITEYITRPSNYTVPNGKTLYVTNWYSTGNDLEIEVTLGSGRGIVRWNTNTTEEERGIINPIILRSTDVISTSGYGGSGYINGFLVDSKTEVDPISLELTNSSSYGVNSYVVPNNKHLVILNAAYVGVGPLTINTKPVFNYSGYDNVLKSPILAKSGDLLEATHTLINGYLVDENYFANCGGGGGSSSTTINYDSLANIISMDSTFLANVGEGGSGCDIQYPDGLDGDPITYNLSSSYTVPAGKNLYITNLYSQSGFFSIDGVNVLHSYSNYNQSSKTAMPFIAKQGQVLLHSSSAGSFNGFLVDALVEPITYNLSSSYTVPVGKNLYITNLYSQSGFFSIDGVNVLHSYSNYNQSSKTAMPFIAKQGQVLLHSSSAGSFNGYLVDENYFANCGGGGSSSATSNTINYMPGGFLQNPYDGDFLLVEQDIQPGNTFTYVVPSGKNLIIDGISGYWSLIMAYLYYNNYPYFNSITAQDLPLDNIPFMEGDSLVFESTNNISQNIIFYGYLIDVDPSIEIVHVDLSSGQTYTVPSGKKLITSDVWSDNCLGINITLNGNTSITSNTFPENVKFLSPGTSISVIYDTTQSPNFYYLFGTLIND